MTLYLPIGSPAAGKSLLAYQAFKSGVLPVEGIVCPDEYRQILTGDINDQTVNHTVFNVVGTIVEHRMYRDLPSWVDATNATVKTVERWISVARKHDRQITVVGLMVPLFIVLERNKVRKGRPEPVPDKVVRRMHATATATWAHYQNNPAPDITVIDAETFRAQLYEPAA